MNETRPSDRALFFVAAAFNWAVALALVVPGTFAWKLLGLAPPQELLFLHFFAVMVAVFGLAYFWIGLDVSDKYALIVVGVIGKLSVFAVTAAYFAAGRVPLSTVLPAVGDFVFAILFIRVALRLRRKADAMP